MSLHERKCKNCGATIPENERVCPSCGRLSVDSERSRLGAPMSETREGSVQRSEDTISQQKQTDDVSQDEGRPGQPVEGPKPDSFYAVAPATPAPVDDGSSDSSSSGGTKGCSPCAILFIVIGWLATIFVVL